MWICGLDPINHESSPSKPLPRFTSILHSEVSVAIDLVSFVLAITGWKDINVSQSLRKKQNIPQNWDSLRVSWKLKMLMYTGNKESLLVAIKNWVFIWVWQQILKSEWWIIRRQTVRRKINTKRIWGCWIRPPRLNLMIGHFLMKGCWPH